MISILRDSIYFRAHRSHLYVYFPGVLWALLTFYQQISQYCDFSKLVLVLYWTILCCKQTLSSYLQLFSCSFVTVMNNRGSSTKYFRILPVISMHYENWSLICVLCFLLLNQSVIFERAYVYRIFFIICLVSFRVFYKGYCEKFC